MLWYSNLFKSPLVGSVALIVSSFFTANQLCAQSGLRESLERLDVNNNGEIEPSEVTPLARPFLEQLANSKAGRGRMSVYRTVSIEKIQEVARRYFSEKNGVNGDDVRPVGESPLKTFDLQSEDVLVPEFGLAKVKYPYVKADLDLATMIMSRYDQNGDGFINRREAERNRWTHRDPFDDDLNNDDRLSRMELTQRYARRRLLDGASRELTLKNWRTGGEIRSSSREGVPRGNSRGRRRGGSSTWLASTMMERFDRNKNGRIEAEEAENLGIPIGLIDADRDGELTREEMLGYVKELQDAVGDISMELPSWFYELDVDRDGQVAMSEFTTEWTDEKMRQFASLDTNGDALLTSSEVSQSASVAGGTYRNEIAEVLPPRRTVISEIEVSEDFLIGDLNIQISITHSHTSSLDAYLTGPDGQQIELFTEVGGSGDNFDQTVFNDQSSGPIVKAKPPYRGDFRPEALDKKKPSLSHFNGKSIQGVWQLVVRGTRSERFGMLHGWSLNVKPVGNSGDSRSLSSSTPSSRSSSISKNEPPRSTRIEESKERERVAATTLERRKTIEAGFERFRETPEGKKWFASKSSQEIEQIMEAKIAGASGKSLKEKGRSKKTQPGSKKESSNKKRAPDRSSSLKKEMKRQGFSPKKK